MVSLFMPKNSELDGRNLPKTSFMIFLFNEINALQDY